MKLNTFKLTLTVFLSMICGFTYADGFEIQRGETLIHQNDVLQSITTDPDVSTIGYPIIQPYQNSPRRDEGEGELLWEDSFANAITDNVALSADGRWVAIGHYLNDERFELRNAEDGEIVISYEVETGGGFVAISEDGSRAAFAAMSSVWIFERERGNEPVFQFDLGGIRPGPIALSRDGRTLVATGIDINERILHAYCFQDDEEAWTYQADMDTTYNWQGVSIARDNSIVALTGKFYLYLLDLASGEGVWGVRTYNAEAPISMSGDGSVIALGSLTGRLTIYNRNEDIYEELWHYSFRGAQSSWISAVSVSNDGSTIGAGSLDFYTDHYGGRLALFDTYGDGTPNWINDSFADEVAGIAMSDNGQIIGATSWGDGGNQSPDLVIHEHHNDEPFYQLIAPGSLSGISMTDDGLRMITGGKGVHNRQFGAGGNVYMVDATLPGGYISGIVEDENNQPVEGVRVLADDNPYEAITDEDGNYRLLIDVDEHRVIALTAEKLGYFHEELVDIGIDRGEEVDDINFELEPTDPPWAEVWASQGERNVISLEVVLIDGMNNRLNDSFLESLTASGEKAPLSSSSITSFEDNIQTPQLAPRRDPGRDVEMYNIYRSYLSGGPYTYIGAIDADAGDLYYDRDNVYPQRRYYYVITADFGNGESVYSDESVGWVDDGFLEYDIDLQSMDMPEIDGSIDDDEWSGAEFREISDIFGYDSPDSAGTAEAYIGFNDETDQLLLAFRFNAVDQLQDRVGVGVYVDDDADERWTYDRPGSEGNYWGYWFDNDELQGPDLRYRSLSGDPYRFEPYFTFDDPLIQFSDEEGYVELEMAIPLGFHDPFEIAVYQPDYMIGLGLFTTHRDEVGNAIFDGWYPQNMLSIVSYPNQFATVHIPVELAVPPVAPDNVVVSRADDALVVDWTDPFERIDNGELNNLEGINIYRNDMLLDDEAAGSEEYFDEAVHSRGWYEYSVSGYILEDGEPFEGPISASSGIYAVEEPDIHEISYDDSSAEGWYVVSFAWNDNRFGVRFDIESDKDTVGIYWIDFPANALDPIDLYIAEDDNGSPGNRVTARFQTTPTVVGDFHRFHFPGVRQPLIALDEFGFAKYWVIMHYSEEIPGSPGIGVDRDNVDEDRNMYHMTDRGWMPFPNGQLMVRVGIGEPPSDIPPVEEPTLPDKFSIEQNFPNPFNSISLIPINLPTDAPVEMRLFDVAGRLVLEQSLGRLPAGRHLAPLDAASLGTGIYIARIATPNSEGIVKIAVLK